MNAAERWSVDSVIRFVGCLLAKILNQTVILHEEQDVTV